MADGAPTRTPTSASASRRRGRFPAGERAGKTRAGCGDLDPPTLGGDSFAVQMDERLRVKRLHDLFRQPS